MKTFGNFTDVKKIKEKNHLKIIKKVLDNQMIESEEFLDDNDNLYLYVPAKNEQVSFGGIRIYIIGNMPAFRIQNEKNTHPYGQSYSLDIESAYNDLLSLFDEKKAGKLIIEEIGKQIKDFFTKTAEIENGSDDEDKTILPTTGTSYANNIWNTKAGNQW